jgi:hypothetical protein
MVLSDSFEKATARYLNNKNQAQISRFHTKRYELPGLILFYFPFLIRRYTTKKKKKKSKIKKLNA